MITFVILAAVLTIAGVALIAVPLLKKRPVEYSPAPWAALTAAVLLAVGSTVLYVRLTNWSWETKVTEDSPQTMVARLARKLEKDPQNLDGWLLLGRSYTQLQEFPLATRAYQRADRLSGKALFFGAAVAMRRGELPLARERFTKLLALDPPDNIKPLLQKQIETIDQQMAGGAPGGGAGPAGQPPVAAATDPAAKVRINVTVAPTLAQSASGSSPLFVFVRDPQKPGPPLAVKRLASHFPQTVELTAADSMLPGRAIAAGQKVQVVARISRSGNPVGASGDLFGESAYLVGRDGLINIVIDHITP
jgi:cytochrome c-type biogenesis protein CcmH